LAQAFLAQGVTFRQGTARPFAAGLVSTLAAMITSTLSARVLNQMTSTLSEGNLNPIGTVRVRQRWVYNSESKQIVKSSNLPKAVTGLGVRPAEAEHDDKHPKHAVTAIIFDIILVGVLATSDAAGWEELVGFVGRDVSFEDYSRSGRPGHVALASVVYVFGFSRMVMPFLSMWIFATVFNNWFVKETVEMPTEFGGNTDFKTGEAILVPTVFAMLALAYNKGVCITQAGISFGASLDAGVFNRSSTNCGHYLLQNGTTVYWNQTHNKPTDYYFPAQPCDADTFGSCFFETTTLVAYHMGAIAALLYVRKYLQKDDWKVGCKTIHWFLWTQALSLACYTSSLAYQAYYIFYTENIKSDIHVSFVMNCFAEAANFAPFAWMATNGIRKRKFDALPFDAEYMTARAGMLFKVSLTNILLVGVKANFHNGLFVNRFGEWTMELKRNAIPLCTPFCAFGMKMLYFDDSHFVALGVNRHPIDLGPARAILWLSVQVLAVIIGALITKCLNEIIMKGRSASGLHERVLGAATAFLVFIMAVLGYIRRSRGDEGLGFRKRRKTLLRLLVVAVMLSVSCFGPDLHHHPGGGESRFYTTWMSLFGPFFLALLERALDRWYPESRLPLSERFGCCRATQDATCEFPVCDPNVGTWAVAYPGEELPWESHGRELPVMSDIDSQRSAHLLQADW